jgi:hypothetical protein
MLEPRQAKTKLQITEAAAHEKQPIVFVRALWRITFGIGLWLFSSIRDKFPDYLVALFTLLLVIFARNA